MGQPEDSVSSCSQAGSTCFRSPGLQGAPSSRVGLGPTPRKEEAATSRYLPLGSSPTQQVEKRERALGGDDGIGHPGRPQLHTGSCQQQGRRERQRVQQGITDERHRSRRNWGKAGEGWQSAPFESTIGKLGRVSGQTGFFR